MTLTGRTALVAAAAVLVVLAIRSTVTVEVVDGLLLAAVILDVLLAAPVRDLRLRRSGDARVRLGEPATVTTTIANVSRRPLKAKVRDAWPPSAAARPAQAALVPRNETTPPPQPHPQMLSIPPGGQGRLVMTVSPARHGDCLAAGVTIRSFGPMGLAARQRTVPVPWTVRALPPFHSRKHLPGKLAQLRELDGQHRAVRPGQGSEFDSLREYVIGDDVRTIDWRSTARRADVVVRTFRPERDRRIVFVLDVGRTAAGRVAGYPRLDTFMEAIQLLTALASQAGDRIDLIAVDQRVRGRILAPSRTTALSVVTDALATLDAELTETDWRLAVATVLAHARRRCLVVLLTDLNSSVALVPELRALVSRHELLIGAVSDPRVAELASGRGDAASVYAAAAAASFDAERTALAAKLTRLGATVVDAPPDRLPPALADAYLSLKGRGRL
jgi:uncharacterized protein (DUF58 family)